MALRVFSNFLNGNTSSLLNFKVILPHQVVLNKQNLHTTAFNLKISKWTDQNEWVYPPQKPGEPRRPAVSLFYFIYSCITHV